MELQKIKPLLRSVHGPLRSSLVLFDLARVVEELVNNSLDASATKVIISVGVTSNYVKVEDDGCGITRDELVLLGEKYATSKSGLANDMKASSQSLGFRGEALSSLSDISIVEVRTKARGRPNAYCKVIKGSRCLFLGIDDQKEDPGTAVIVRDLFYNQPVRRRCMHSSPKKMLHSVKKCVLRTALVHSEVLFRVNSIESEDELLCTIPSLSPLPLVADMFGNEVSSSLHEINFRNKMLVLSGYISKPGNVFSRKAFQYLYINSRFVSKGPIHNLLNNLMLNSQCSLANQRVSEFQSGKRQKIQTYPAFLLNLCCPASLYDLNFEPSKTLVEFKDLDAILSFFEKAIRSAWDLPSFQWLEDKSGLTEKNKVQKHDVERSIHIRKNRRNTRVNENFLQIPITNPKVFAAEDAVTFHIDEKSRQFSWEVESSQSNINSSSRYITDADHDFSPEIGQINISNRGTNLEDDCLLLENLATSDFMSHVKEEYCILGSGWKIESPKGTGSGSLGKKSDLIIASADHDFSISSREFLLGASSKSANEHFSSPRFERCNSDYYPGNYGCLFKTSDSRKDFPLSDNTGFNTIDDRIESWNFEDILCEETFDVLRPSLSVLRKCETKKTIDVLTSDEDSMCSFSQKFVPEKNVGPQCGKDCSGGGSPHEDCFKGISPERELSLPYPSVWNDKLFRKACHPAKEMTIEKNFSTQNIGSSTNCVTDDKVEYLNTRIRFSAVDPKIKRELHKPDSYFVTKHKTKMESSNPLDEVASEILCFSDKLDDKPRWSHSNPSNAIDIGCDLKSKWQPDQNDDATHVNSWNIIECHRYQPLSISKVRSRRSWSAPPIFKGKRKFLLCGHHLTMEEGKETYPQISKLPETAESPNESFASQSFPQSALLEASQRHFRDLDHENPNILEEKHSRQGINDVEEYSASELTKWRPGLSQDGNSPYSPVEHADDILNISSEILHLSGASLVPESLDKACLQDSRVLLQLDRKFIPVMANGMLVIIDQHAADERIRLEELRRKVLSGECTTITYLDSEQELILPEMGFQLLQKYKEKIQKWGWVFNTHGQLIESFKKKRNVPRTHCCGITLLAVPTILDINLTEKDLIEFIEQLVETDGSSTVPPSVVRILNFKACRGAIMFGDSLLPSECSLIVEELKATSLCFQCAHGRPTAAPLLNMVSLHEQLSKINMQKGGSMRTWHGLSNHKPSLRRAKMRLDSAKRFHNE